MGKLDAIISLPASAIPPDPLSDNYRAALPLDHVISRDSEGRKISCVGDFVWDWTAYDPRGVPRNFYFYYWTILYKRLSSSDITTDRVARMREMQLLMAHLVFCRRGAPLAISSVKMWLQGLSQLACFAESIGRSLKDVLVTQDLLDRFIAGLSDYSSRLILAWLYFLWESAEVERLGFAVAIPRNLKELQRRSKVAYDSFKQHVPLPTRVYASVINSLIAEMDDIEEHAERLISALHASATDKNYVKKGGTFGSNLISHFGLEDYFDRRGLERSLNGLSSAIADVYRVCKLQIHVFSGMRDAEAGHLPFHCMRIERQENGNKHCLIVGVTSKLNGGRPMRAKWVTTQRDGFRAIAIAQRFASVLYGFLGVYPSDHDSSRNNYPLFLSTTYLPWGMTKNDNTPKRFASFRGHLGMQSSSLRVRVSPIIQEEDICELEEIDPFRDWHSEPEYAVGKPWPLKPHQLRRSLALYANASGLVRVSSLRRQLQHITREMSLYYARGSAFSVNFISLDPDGFKRHVVREWQDGQQESQYLAFVRDVLESDEPLYGAAGKFYEMQKQRDHVVSVDHFKKQIKMGRLSYHATPLGGCTSSIPCKSPKGLRLVNVACITEGCKNLIGKHSKIIQTIRMQAAILGNMDLNSINYQIEKEDLDALVVAEESWRPIKGVADKPNGDKHG